MKEKLFLIAALLIIAVMPVNTYSQQDVNGWFWLNGQPQGNTVRWAKVFDASNMFAVSDRGIFMKSTDGGDTWLLSQAGAPDLSSTGGLSKRNLYTGWFFNANTGIVAGQSQTGSSSKAVVSKTTDGGTTWNIKDVNSFGFGSVNGIHFINSSTGFLCGGNSAFFYKTTDQGETWTEISSVPVPADAYYSVYAFDENKIMLGTFPRKIVKTTDGGASWTEYELPGAPSNTQIMGITFKDANTGYAIGNPNYFAYTTNGGTSWNASTHSSVRGQRALVYDNGIVWTAGDYSKVYKSTNNGANWDSVQFFDNSNPNQPPQFITYGIGANGNDLVVVGNYGQITTSNDGGVTWRNKNYSVNASLSLTYASIFVESPNGNIWVGPEGGGNMLYSSNGGANWISQTTSHTSSVYSIDFLNSNTGFICGGSSFSSIGELSKTTNRGATWIPLTLPGELNYAQLNCVEFINENTGWVTGGLGPFTPAILYKTTNGGISWFSQGFQPSYDGNGASVKMIDANTGYALGNTLYSTSNGGTNWIRSENTFISGVSPISMFVLNKDVIYLCGFGTSNVKKIVRSIDGGNTWTDLTNDLIPTVSIFETKWLNVNHGIVSGTNGYMAKTTNGGMNWTGSNPGISTTVDISFPNKNVWYGLSDRNGYYPLSRKLENVNTISLNVFGIVEGFWNGTVQCLDTVTVELRNSTSPYSLVDQAKGIFSSSLGYASVEFNSAATGSYYIVVKHRNSIETWSAAPVALARGGTIHTYDFTSSASQAYGNNTVLKSGKYCLYSGDVNQDGIVDASDASLIDNDAFNFVSGYTPTDLNCDGFTDASDGSIADNNVFNIVSISRP